MAEREIVAIKAMEAPNLAAVQALTIHTKVVAIETQMETFGKFVKAEMLKIQDEQRQRQEFVAKGDHGEQIGPKDW